MLEMKQAIDKTDFGEVVFQVKRARSKTVEITTLTTDTHSFESNIQAIEALNIVIEALLETGKDYDITFNIQIKKGMIKLIGYQNIKNMNYGS